MDNIFKFGYDCIIFDLNGYTNWIFKDGDKEYIFNKEEFIKKFLVDDKSIKTRELLKDVESIFKEGLDKIKNGDVK